MGLGPVTLSAPCDVNYTGRGRFAHGTLAGLVQPAGQPVLRRW